MITAEAPSDGRTLVLAPTRRWDPPPRTRGRWPPTSARIPWLTAVDALQAAASTEPVDRGPLVYPRRPAAGDAGRPRSTPDRHRADAGRRLPQRAEQRECGDRAGAVRGCGAAGRLVGLAHRRPGRGGVTCPAAAGRSATLRGAVTMSSPATGDYTFASSDSPLLLTLENRLAVPVTVRLRLTTPPGFAPPTSAWCGSRPADKRTVRVPATVQRTGLSPCRAGSPPRTRERWAARSRCRVRTHRVRRAGAGHHRARVRGARRRRAVPAVRRAGGARARGTGGRRQPGRPEPAVTGWTPGTS